MWKKVDKDTTNLDLSLAVVGTLPDEIWKLTQLTIIYLNHNQLTTLPDGIGQLTQLTELYLNHTDLTILPDGIC